MLSLHDWPLLLLSGKLPTFFGWFCFSILTYFCFFLRQYLFLCCLVVCNEACSKCCKFFFFFCQRPFIPSCALLLIVFLSPHIHVAAFQFIQKLVLCHFKVSARYIQQNFQCLFLFKVAIVNQCRSFSSVVKHALLVPEIWGTIPGSVKLVQYRHRCDVPSELCCSETEPRRPPLVTRFGLIRRVLCRYLPVR